jgi:RNA polymerase sigma-70 factor (ECF subfamily)
MWLFKRKKDRITIGLNDEELVKAYFTSGDKGLVGALFEKHVVKVYGACLFYFNDKEQAKDAVMQIFEKMITELRKTQVQNFKAWLSFVVRNYCISELRKNKSRRFVSESYLDFEIKETTLDEEEKIASIEEDQMVSHMNEMLPRLKENQKICVELFYLKSLSYQEISDQTGYTIGEVKSYIQNGKRNLKMLVEERIDKNGKRNKESRT